MFSFEGDFRTKPKVSLGGASKQEEKSSLLSRTLDERRKREDERRRQRNAVVIQSFVRGCITRCKQHNAQRCIFDEFATRLELAGDVATYSHIAGKLLFFYNESLDTSRLVYVCQGLLRHHTAFLQLLAGPNSLQVLYRLQRLLLLCCRLFRVESEVLAVPLRMVEVFISLESYKAALSCCPPPCVVPQKPPSVAGTASSPLRATVALENVLFYLVRNEYFHYHCCLLNQRLPPHLEYPAPHTVPLASLLVNNLLEPLQLQYTSCGPRSRQRVLCHFIREVLCVPYTEQMHSFLLPALSDRADAFPYTPLLEALHNAGDHDGQCMGMSRATDDAKQMANLRRAGQEGSGFGIPWLELWGSPWLLHAMLTLGERHLGSLLEPHVLLYLRVLQSLLHRLPSSTRAQHTGSGVGDSEDEDDDEQESRMSADKAGPEGRPWEHVVREECLHMLDSREQTSTLLAAVWSPSAGEQVLTVMASICHQLMVDHRVMVPRTRLLYSLAFHPRFLRHLWHLITTLSTTMITGSQVPLLQLLSRGAPLQPCDSSRIVPVFYLFCSLFGHFLISVHDNEFFGDEQSGCNMTPYTNCTKSSMPFSLAELVEMSLRLRDACLGIIQLAYPDSRPELRDSYAQALQGSSVRRAVAQPAEQRLQEQRTRYTHLFKVISNLVKMLKARDARRHFCPRNHWLSQQVTICADRVPQLYMPGTRHVWRSHRLHNIGPLWSTLDVGQDCPPLSVPEERQLAILTELPFVVPFAERVKIFQRLIMVEKEESQGESSFFGGINVVIRRNYIYEDAFDKLSPENGNDTPCPYKRHRPQRLFQTRFLLHLRMDYYAEMEWDNFAIPWSPTTCVELHLQIDELDSNLLSMEEIVSEIRNENSAFNTTWDEVIFLFEDILNNQDPQNEFYLDDQAKELYLGDPQNPEKEFYYDDTYCELSKQNLLNKFYLDEPEYKSYIGDPQISENWETGILPDGPQLYYVRHIIETLKNWEREVFPDGPQLYYVRLITETPNISENCGSTLETWKDGYIFGGSEWGFCCDDSECDTYLGGSTGMWLYLGNLESWFYFGDSTCGVHLGDSLDSKAMNNVLCLMTLDLINIKKV
uniref:ubiquitin-protein ligase E3C isoform X2 n=1 Tax=Myxine glutinosa TaxID=7769 RepID=UPI00358EF0D1